MNANQYKPLTIVLAAFLIGGKDLAAIAMSMLPMLGREQASESEQAKAAPRKRRRRKRDHKQLELPFS